MKTKKAKPVYKITAQVIKPGGLPTTWTRFTDCKMTQKQCEKLLSSRREAGKSIPVSVRWKILVVRWSAHHRN